MNALPSEAQTSSTRRIIAGFMMHSPSSEKATAPADAIECIEASCSPLRPTVAAPTTKTRAFAASRAACWTKRTVVAVSIAGFVFGMQQTVAKPPATAEAVPLLTVSFASPPGSRRWTCGSISPGVTSMPPQATTRAPSGASMVRPGATFATRPSTTSTSPSASIDCAASRMRPPRKRIAPELTASAPRRRWARSGTARPASPLR